MKYIKGIDTLRAFAILCVILFHWVSMHPRLATLPALFRLFFIPDGHFGVNLFFVISGFLITGILLNAKDKNQNGLAVIKNFVVRRALRIFPVYYLLIIALLITHYPFEPGSLIWFLTYTSNFWVMKIQHWRNFAHAWSLAVEEQFYLVWPWLILFVKNAKLKYVLLLFIFLGPLSVAWFHFGLKSEWFYTFTVSCFDAFGIGALYSWMRHREQYDRISKWIWITFPAALAVYMSWKACLFFGIDNPPLYCFTRTIDSLVSIGLIHFVIVNRSAFVKKYMLETPVLTFIGRISYGMYLFHGVMPYYYEKYLAKPLLRAPIIGAFTTGIGVQFGIMLLLTIAASFISFTLIEKPILTLKNRFRYAEQ